jgi:thiol-disulfide isomerase/thioredoxin
MFTRSLAVAALALTAQVAVAGDEEAKGPTLTVGDSAPALDVAWVKGSPVANFAKGQPYVVEFWATWCGPCKKAMPHMTELQKEYGDKVRFIGVSIWEDDPADVEGFVEKMGEKIGYAIAKDVDKERGKTAMAWMAAADQDGIPTAFIVNGEGKVAWIGSPFEIDEPLEKVVANEWNVAKARGEHEQKAAAKAVARKLGKTVKTAMYEEKWSEALTAMDTAFAAQPKLEADFGVQKFVALHHLDLTKASAYGQKVVASIYKDDPMALNHIAWTVVDPAAKVEKRDLALAASAAKRACELTEWKEPAILDTYALAVFLAGDHEKALEIQTKAVEHSKGSPYEEELKGRLEEYRQAIGAQG